MIGQHKICKKRFFSTFESIFLFKQNRIIINRHRMRCTCYTWITSLFGRCSRGKFCIRHYSCSVCNMWSTLVTGVTVRHRHWRWHSPLSVTTSVWHSVVYSSGKPHYSGDSWNIEVRQSRIWVQKILLFIYSRHKMI